MSAPVDFFVAYLASALPAGTPESSIVLDRITNLNGEEIATGDFADLGRGILTVNPDADGLTEFPESISFTTVDPTDTTLDNAIRGLDKNSVSQVTLMRYHPIGTPVIISFGSHNIQDLLSYITAAIAAATFGTSNVVTATCGENVVAGNILYLKNDGKWWKTDADLVATVDSVELGIAQGTGTANGAITGGVLLGGLDGNQTALVVGTTYYISNTAGAISATPGTIPKVIGVAKSTSSIYFDPKYGSVPNNSQTQFLLAATGMVVSFAMSSIPTGFLACDGTAVSRTTYAALFAAIGTTWGVGDGSTTFNVPDLRGRVEVGSGTGTKVATFASRASNIITVTGLSNVANNEFQTGQAVTYHAATTVMTGLTNDTIYYIVRVTNTTFSLASTLANAQNGVVISLSSDGSGAQTFTLALTARLLGQTGGEENHAMSVTELLAHTHSVTGFSSNAAGSASVTTGTNNATAQTVANAATSTGGNVAINEMMPNVVLTKAIKT